MIVVLKGFIKQFYFGIGNYSSFENRRFRSISAKFFDRARSDCHNLRPQRLSLYRLSLYTHHVPRTLHTKLQKNYTHYTLHTTTFFSQMQQFSQQFFFGKIPAVLCVACKGLNTINNTADLPFKTM